MGYLEHPCANLSASGQNSVVKKMPKKKKKFGKMEILIRHSLSPEMFHRETVLSRSGRFRDTGLIERKGIGNKEKKI